MENYLELKKVALIYHSPEGETQALGDISFTVEREEFAAIVGPSGCGKTTILSLLAGLLKPSSGEITVGGKPLEEINGIMGLMPQRDQLFEWRNILKNVLLGLEIKRTKTPETVAYAEKLLEKYGLGDFTKKRPSELSGGMRQRAALIRTLVTDPEILLLDEPFSALDFQTRLKVCDDVHGIIRSEKKTAILVTHDISEAISLADKVIVLSERPATIKRVYNINLAKEKTPLARREEANFSKYFKKIWSDLEVTDDKRT